MLKDLTLAMTEAEEQGLSMPVSELAELAKIYTKRQRLMGMGRRILG